MSVPGSLVLLLLVRISSVASDESCIVTESDRALGFGVKASYPVRSCRRECLFHNFLTEQFPKKIVTDPELAGDFCKCYYSARFWETSDPSFGRQFWFQFRTKKRFRECNRETCQQLWFDWGDMYNKKKHYPGDSERLPQRETLESQENYELNCVQGAPTGIVLPSPGGKITELRLELDAATDDDEINKLQKLLDDLEGDKSVEVFHYDLDGEWGPEHKADASTDGGMHTFQLKPCVSNQGRIIEELHEIFELCGSPREGESKKMGEVLKFAYDLNGEWEPEQAVDWSSQRIRVFKPVIDASRNKGKLLSFRLRPCRIKGGEKKTSLEEILSECGPPQMGVSLLPVLMSVQSQFGGASAPEGHLQFPCTADTPDVLI